MSLELDLETYKLALDVELADGQTLASYLSALAARNGLQSSARFCIAFGLDLVGIQRGEQKALAMLADLAGVPIERLARAGSRRRPTFTLMGQDIDAADIGAHLRVCPQCITEDHAKRPHWPFPAAAKYRAAWSHSLVQSCAIHDLQLVGAPVSLEKLPKGDFAIALRDIESMGIVLPTIARTVSPLEIYIQDRLAELATGIDMLDSLALADATFLCRYLGAPHREARRAIAPANVDEALEQANRGFGIAQAGTAAIRARLGEIAGIVNPYGAAEIGLRRVFMSLYDRVRSRVGSDMLTIRQMLVEVGVVHCLIDVEQTEALGLTVPARSRQTLESAKRGFGVSDRELRAALIELQAIPHDDLPRAANAVLFAVAPMSAIVARIKDSLNLIEAARLLGLHPQQLVNICDAGLLKPFFTRPSQDLKPLRYFERAEVEGFLARLSANCQCVPNTDKMVDIWEAGLKICRQPIEIIAAIHDGRIARTYRAQRQPSIHSIRVILNDIRSITFEASDDLMSPEDCSRLLNINLSAMRAIMQSGILQSEPGINPINHRRQQSARMNAVQTFDREFVSLNGLRARFSTSGPGMAQALFKAGARPAFPINQSVVAIYRRDDVARVLSKVQRIVDQRQAMSRQSGRRR